MIEIIEGAKQGFAEALNKICELYKNQIYYFCVKLVGEADTASDLCAETFNCAFEELDTLEQPEQFEIWIKNIAAIKCFNYIHKMKPMLFLQAVGDTGESLFSESEMENMQKGDIEETKTAAVMDEMLNRLNDAQRMTLMLHYYNNLSVAQIAKIMSCNSDIVKQRMAKAAEQMKTTIDALSAKEVKLSPVEFRTALQLMVACTAVPAELDGRINGIIEHFATDEVPAVAQEIDDAEYVIDRYVNNAERDVGEAEHATAKFTENDGVALGESVFARFAPKEEDEKHESQILKTSKAVTEGAKRAAKKASKGAAKKFTSLSMMQQSVALLLVVAVIAAIIIGVSLKNKKENPDVVSSVAPAVASVQSTVSVAPIPTYKLDFGKEEKSVKAADGTILALASYQYPMVTLSENPEAEEIINSFFSAEKGEVLTAFDGETKEAEYNYMYSTKAYGEWKQNEHTVTMQSGRVDESFVNFAKSDYSYYYGNVYGNTELTGYSFSSVNGKQLTLQDVVEDIDGYVTYATDYICKALEKRQEDGEFSLYTDYNSTVSETLRKEGRWYFTDAGLTVIFNPDEVVYYTYGVQTFELPYSEINGYLFEQYQK